MLTAAHVIDDGDGELQVIFGGRNGHPEFDGADGQRVQAEIFPGPRDLAVLSNLQIPDWAQGVQIGDTSPRNGEILTSVGLEQPGAVRVRSAEVVGSHSRQPLIFLGVQAQQGNSGGPVFNEGGELIGLNSAVGVHIDHNIEVTEDPRGQTITIITRQVPATWVIDLPRIRSDFD